MKVYIKMEKTIITFGDIEIKNQKNHQDKKPISINSIDINKIRVSNKVFFGKKGFKYLLVRKMLKIRPLCIFLSKMSASKTDFGKTKYISFFVINDKLLEKYNKIWEKS